MAVDLLLRPTVLIPCVLFAIYVGITRLRSRNIVLETLPWGGVQSSELFSRVRAKLRALTRAKEIQLEAYYKYTKNGKSFVLPSVMTWPEIMVPQSQIRSMLAQPDDVLNTKQVHHEFLEAQYTFPSFMHNPTHEAVVKRDLTRQLGALTMDIMEELATGFDEYWGLDTNEWKEIVLYKNMMQIVARTSNRIFVGVAVCRNEEYLSNSQKFAQDVIMGAFLIKMFPSFLKPIVGPIIALPNRWHTMKCAKYTVPMIKQRFADIERAKTDSTFKHVEPNDAMQWLIRNALVLPDPVERKPMSVAWRIQALNFAAIHTSTISVTNALFDLFSAPPEKGYVEGLKEEVTRVLAEENGQWTKAGLARMVRVDSVIRESMRLRGFGIRGLTRKVVAEKGVTLEDGLHLPYGTKVGVPMYGIHHDQNIYSNADEFDAFRFSRPREEYESTKGLATANGVDSGANGKTNADHEDILHFKNMSMVTTGEDYLPFGHGRHACPGRFFAANEIKLLIAYIILNYDVEPLPVRPEPIWVADNVSPPPTATIRVRRRAAV